MKIVRTDSIESISLDNNGIFQRSFMKNWELILMFCIDLIKCGKRTVNGLRYIFFVAK